jgi:predicted ATPase/class 3 adenylate cyclase
MARDLPTGTLTFFFSDIEGSTKLVQRLGLRFKDLLERHEALVREAMRASGGTEVRTVGDAFFIVFPTADAAVAAAVAAQRTHAAEPWPEDGVIRMRVGMHTGQADLGGDDYVGIDVHLAARIAGAAHGGQIVISDRTKALLGPSDGVHVRDLGDHRLKDVGALRLWQVTAPGLAVDFPPLASLEVPTNLPADVTDFVGREREVAEVRDLMRTGRLVTLTGPGGTGKTRLSLRVAREIVPEFPHGVFFVPLEPIRDPALVPGTIAEAIGVREEPARALTDVVKERLRDRATLLVLDNFEQVVPAAPIVADLLRAAPRLRCLASSREVLRVYGEHEYPVSTLDDGDALTLFERRAAMAKPGFALSEQGREIARAICERLDRLPLAIELAAARLKVFTLEALRTRLEKSLQVLGAGARDLPERQRTLRGAIAWSYDLLSESERALFRRLAVFVGGCQVEAAEAISPGGELDVVDVLASFVDKSLLRCTEDPDGATRFRMLETIREYGTERLAETGELEDVRRRHALWVLGLVEAREAELTGGEDKPWLDRLAAEHDNVRAATRWALETGDAATGMRIASAVWRFWQQRGHLAEGRRAVEALLALPAAAAPTRERAQGLTALAGIAYWQSDFAQLGPWYEETVRIYRDLDDRRGLADALYNLSFVPFISGDLDRAGDLMEQSRAIYSDLGDDAGLAKLGDSLTALRYRQGKLAEAIDSFQAVLRYRRAQKNAFYLGDSLTLYSLLLIGAGRMDDAKAVMKEALETQIAVGNIGSTAALLLLGAIFALRRGDAVRAARLVGAVDAIKERTSIGATPLEVLGVPHPSAEARATLGDEAFERDFREGRKLSVDEAGALALGA